MQNLQHQTAPEMSVVIPVYNEAQILEESIIELHAGLTGFGRTFEIIIAENGSKDETPDIAEKLSNTLPGVRYFRLGRPNYGAALKRGIIEARGTYIHCDEIDICDLDFHRRALELFVGEDGGFDLIVGSKVMHGARDRRPLGRRVATRVINGMLRVSLGFHGTDTHGLKAFKKSALMDVINACVVDKDMFASELVIRAERAGKYIVEIPLNLEEKRTPSIQLHKRVPRVLKNICQLVYVIRLQGR